MKDGFILIHRKLLDWEWYQNTNDTRLFIHFLLKANWKDGTYKGNEIPRGSFVTTFNKLAEETGLSIQQIRTSIKHLKLTQEITQEQHGYFSVITIRKYNDYQLDNTQINTQATDEQQTYRIKEKKEKKSKKESISKDIPKKKFLKPTIQEIADYCKERNNGIDADYFYDFYESKGWMVGSNNMKNWKACVRTWEKQSKKSEYKKEALPSWFNNEQKGIQLNDEEQRLYDELTRGS